MTRVTYKIVPSSYLMLIQEGKILLAGRVNTGFQDGNYGLISGHGEINESAIQALLREAKEEAGIDIAFQDVEIAHIMHRKAANDERVDFFFTVKKYQGKLEILEKDKCDNMEWFFLDKLPENTIDYIRQAIECYQKNILYSEYGWDNRVN